MAKVMIFSASTGGGHNQVAAVIRCELEARGHQVEKVDFLEAGNPLLKTLVSDSYNNMIVKTRRLYGFIYKTSNRPRLNQNVKRVFHRLADKNLAKIIDVQKPELVIATHAIAVDILGNLKAKNLIDCCVLAVITDFDVHRFSYNQHADAYIVASENSKKMLTDWGIESGRIHICGIPIRREFWNYRYDAKDQTSEGIFTILIMGGSSGMGDMEGVLDNILDVSAPIKAWFVCGSNNELKMRLEKRLAMNNPVDKHIEIFGFTDDIPRLMHQASIIITKPGGITVSEAISQRLPIVVPYYLAGHEEGNVRMLVNMGVAIDGSKHPSMSGLIEMLIAKPGQLTKMKARLEEVASLYSLDAAIAIASALIEQKTNEHATEGEGN